MEEKQNKSNYRMTRHDRLQLEIKLNYPAAEQNDDSKNTFNVWFHLPSTTGISASSYSSSEFYSDLRIYTRLTTPNSTVEGLSSGGPGSPLSSLNTIYNLTGLDGPTKKQEKIIRREAKLLCCMFRRSIDLEIIKINDSDIEASEKTDSLLTDLKVLLKKWRSIKERIEALPLSQKTQNCLRYVDDALSIYTEGCCVRLHELLKSSNKKQTIDKIVEIHKQETKRQEKFNSKSVLEQNSDGTSYLIRVSNLKKFVSSSLFLEALEDKYTYWLSHIGLGIAAGIAMTWAVFAQVFAFHKLGMDLNRGVSISFLFAFSVIAIISYMLKDRIKATTAVWISKKISRKYHDRKHLHLLPEEQTIVAETMEQMNFIPADSCPDFLQEQWEKLEKSNLSIIVGGEILHYRRQIKMFDQKAHQVFTRFNGVTDILRINLWRWVQSMDDPKKKMHIIEKSGDLETRKLRRQYIVDATTKMEQVNGEVFWKHYRIWLDRSGIASIEELAVNTENSDVEEAAGK